LSVPKGVDCQNQLEYREAYESLQNYARLIFPQFLLSHMERSSSKADPLCEK